MPAQPGFPGPNRVVDGYRRDDGGDATNMADIERHWAQHQRPRSSRPTTAPHGGVAPAPGPGIAAVTFDTRMARWTAERNRDAARNAVAQHATWLQRFRKQVSTQYRATTSAVTNDAAAFRRARGATARGGARVDYDTNSSLAGLLSPRHERYRSSSPRDAAAALNFNEV